MTAREYVKTEREAQITEALASGPMTATGIARQLSGIPAAERIPRSFTARITQSLRVLEREGIVARGLGSHGRLDWRLRTGEPS